MRRLFGEFAYSEGPRDQCYWSHSTPDLAEACPPLTAKCSVDYAVIGGGFTGLSAALKLAETGCEVALLDARYPGWGASGRNGGFCCIGGGRASNATLMRRHGPQAAQDWHRVQRDAIAHVSDTLDRHGIDADTHSQGETELAHHPRAMRRLRREAAEHAKDATPPRLIEAEDLAAAGLGGGPFYGALTRPDGFGLDPGKYTLGLVKAAQAAGARLWRDAPVRTIRTTGDGFSLDTPQGSVTCRRLILATNGYSSEDVPNWLGGRYIPAQSSVLVTRPLSDSEIAAQSWHSVQMAYDSRHLLHYFRLMPNRRFLFGMRGGLRATPASEATIRRELVAHFHRMFPAWSAVDIPFTWSGMISLSPLMMPFCGAIPEMPGAFAALSYHGNGVAMASYCGTALADLARGHTTRDPALKMLAAPPPRFALGRYRRALMWPGYGLAALGDQFGV